MLIDVSMHDPDFDIFGVGTLPCTPGGAGTGTNGVVTLKQIVLFVPYVWALEIPNCRIDAINAKPNIKIIHAFI
jgi:hypothetical protein